MPIRFRGGVLVGVTAALGAFALLPNVLPADEPLIVTATRLEVPESESPAAVSILEVPKLEERQINRVADALRDVPGLDVVQTGAPGQLTSVFTRGLNSNDTQVLVDGIPLNQGLAGLYDFANLTTTGLQRIEVQRGPLSTLYGPHALGGVIQIFTKQGSGPVGGAVSFEGGSFDSFRERAGVSGSIGSFDYMAAVSRFDTDNQRPNNQYRATNAAVNLGWSPLPTLRIGVLTLLSKNDTGNPGEITNPKPLDNLLTKQFLIAPNITFSPVTWWKHHLVVSYDQEKQINDPNDDGFTGPTTARFIRTQVDYQNDLEIAKWFTLTSGMFYANNSATQLRPQVSFGSTVIGDHTTEIAGFMQASVKPVTNLLIVLGGRIDSFSDFGTVGTWRLAASYVIAETGTTLRSSYATGFSAPSIQDKIFRVNVDDVLNPERSRGFDIGFEQALWRKQLTFGANFFYNHLSNIVGFDNNFNTFNLGRARTQGIETFARWEPVKKLVLTASYTYLDARRTNSADISQPDGARLPRRARNQLAASISYQCFNDRLTAGFEGRMVNGREDINFGAPNTEIPDYSVCRLWANYQLTKQLQLTARVENLTNRSYAEVPNFPSLSRGFYGGLEWKF
jgi:vitamin B12 transporter